MKTTTQNWSLERNTDLKKLPNNSWQKKLQCNVEIVQLPSEQVASSLPRTSPPHAQAVRLLNLQQQHEQPSPLQNQDFLLTTQQAL